MDNCMFCKGGFTVKVKGQKFCKPRCRDSYHNASKRKILSLWKDLDPEMQEKVIKYIEWENNKKEAR